MSRRDAAVSGDADVANLVPIFAPAEVSTSVVVRSVGRCDRTRSLRSASVRLGRQSLS